MNQRAVVGLEEWGRRGGGGGKKMDEGQSRGNMGGGPELGPIVAQIGRAWKQRLCLANTGTPRGSLSCLETSWHTKKPAQEIPATPEGSPYNPHKLVTAVFLAAVGDTDRYNVSPVLSPSQVHRCRGPKIRVKLAVRGRSSIHSCC